MCFTAIACAARSLDDRRRLFRLHLFEVFLRRIHLNERAGATQSQTADAANLHLIRQTLRRDFAVKGLLDGETSRRGAPCRGAAADARRSLTGTLILGNLLKFSQVHR
jgi:hypothetical protein